MRTFHGLCAVCGEPQYDWPNGRRCVNAHVNAEALEPIANVPLWEFTGTYRDGEGRHLACVGVCLADDRDEAKRMAEARIRRDHKPAAIVTLTITPRAEKA